MTSGSSHIRLLNEFERDLSAFWAGDNATPSRGPLARLEQHHGTESARALGALRDLIHLDVGQPQRPPGGALDDPAAEAATRREREIGTAARPDELRPPVQQPLVEGARAHLVAGVQLQVDDLSRDRPLRANLRSP